MKHSFFQNILWIGCFGAATMASTSINDFFPDINGNLTKITWAHAVNNHTYLLDTLNNQNIMMIEADVVLGTVDGYGEVKPIMAHPPENNSDLSLLAFFVNVNKFNLNETNVKKKGVKLDFKSIEAFLAAVKIVEDYGKDTYPIWINADIISGPINSTTLPLDPDKFLTSVKSFPNSTLSIGWTTQYGSTSKGSYDAHQIQNMTDAIRRNNVTQDITFPVRAGLAAESVDLLVNLVEEVQNSTITIWSSEGDNVNVDNLRELIAKMKISRVYVDVPNDLLSRLHLDDLPNGGVVLSGVVWGLALSMLIAFINYL